MIDSGDMGRIASKTFRFFEAGKKKPYGLFSFCTGEVFTPPSLV
jgi:hypothetical protein